MNNDSIAISIIAAASCVPATVLFQLPADVRIQSEFPVFVDGPDKIPFCSERFTPALLVTYAIDLSGGDYLDASVQADRRGMRKAFQSGWPSGESDGFRVKDDLELMRT